MRHKGGAFLTIMEWIKQKGGPEGVGKVKALLDPVTQEALFSKPIMAVSWVEFEHILNLCAAADKVYGKGDGKFIGPLAALTTEKLSKGLYRVFFSFMSTEKFINGIPNVWKTMFDKGDISVQWQDKNHCLVILANTENVPATD